MLAFSSCSCYSPPDLCLTMLILLFCLLLCFSSFSCHSPPPFAFAIIFLIHFFPSLILSSVTPTHSAPRRASRPLPVVCLAIALWLRQRTYPMRICCCVPTTTAAPSRTRTTRARDPSTRSIVPVLCGTTPWQRSPSVWGKQECIPERNNL